MIKKLVNALKNVFKKPEPVFSLDINAETIPEAFDCPIDQYRSLVDDLNVYLDFGDQLIAFDYYIKTQLQKKYKLNINNPRHAAIIGYAFCTAVMMQRKEESDTAVENVLNSFYPNQVNFKQQDKLVS